jgi:hypothetical protein
MDSKHKDTSKKETDDPVEWTDFSSTEVAGDVLGSGDVLGVEDAVTQTMAATSATMNGQYSLWNNATPFFYYYETLLHAQRHYPPEPSTCY